MHLFLILCYLMFCAVVGYAGRDRKLGMFGFFFLSLVATPILVGLILIISAPRPSA